VLQSIFRRHYAAFAESYPSLYAYRNSVPSALSHLDYLDRSLMRSHEDIAERLIQRVHADEAVIAARNAVMAQHRCRRSSTTPARSGRTDSSART
jgi:hypothetical protein